MPAPEQQGAEVMPTSEQQGETMVASKQQEQKGQANSGKWVRQKNKKLRMQGKAFNGQ